MEGPRQVSQDRALWEYIMHMERTKYGNKSALPTPGFLRSDVVLATENQINFALLANEQNQGQEIMPFEQRLQQNDAFYVTRGAVMFYVYDIAQTPEQALQRRAQAQLQQFPNVEIFGAQQTGNVTAAFKGKFTLAQNEKIYIRDLDVQSMQYADTAQQGLVTGDGSTTYGQNAILADKGFRDLENPMIRLNGQSTVDAFVKLPYGIAFSGGQEQEFAVVATLYLRGWRSQNSGVARIAE
jgi:hypothetical protein